MIFDLAVVGLGGMGSATAAHAAERGLSVAGVEQFEPVHKLGASHGRTRLIRMAYFEGPEYVPLLRRAYELWDELEAKTGAALFSHSGAVYAGARQSDLISGSLASAQEYGLDLELIEGDEVRKRFPLLRLMPNEVALYEPSAGAVFPEATVSAQVARARDAGAVLRFATRVTGWEASTNTVRLALADGEELRAHKLVLTVGPWFATIFRELNIQLEIERNVQVWFDPQSPAAFAPDRFAPFALERGGRFFYGFPDYGDGMKCAFHHTGNFTDPASIDRTVTKYEIEEVHTALSAYIPSAAGAYRESSACMYALTPDHHFVIGRHPGFENVFLAGGFSGHGFKFVPVIGEIMANFVCTGAAGHEISMFSPQRFAHSADSGR
ncbi:MAG: N-methyl-L-tryptophan oxidase [Candidatus Baltobacteraceae bacterium]